VVKIVYRKEIDMASIQTENVPSYVVNRIGAIQQELEQLKKTIVYQAGANKRKKRLKGLWKGIKVGEEDIEEAKRAVFRNAYNLG